MKKIGIDCRLWNETGVGRYIRNIVYELSKLDKENNYVLFMLNKDVEGVVLGDNFKIVKVDIRWHSFKEQFVFPIILYKENLDIFFIPYLNVPVFYFKKFVMTVHDLTVLKIKTGRVSTLPKVFYLIKRLGVNIALSYGIYFSRKIFTVSEFVKTDILENYKIKPSKIFLTPCAVDDKFKRVPDYVAKKVLTKYGIDYDYVFYVGNAHPHKNLEKLIEAFVKVNKIKPNVKLVLGGKIDFFYKRLQREFNYDFIKFIGFIEDEDLPALYSKSLALVNPSLFEGFGLQLLEAFSCGTKVVCSNRTSLPEVGGDAPYYFNPLDIDDISGRLIDCIEDNAVDRINKGYVRVKSYSWEKSAHIIKKVFDKL